MANATKDGGYAQDRRFVKWKGLQTYYVPQHLLKGFHWYIITAYKKVHRSKRFMG